MERLNDEYKMDVVKNSGMNLDQDFDELAPIVDK